MSKVNIILLCGGQGTRLWPLSSSDEPKQFVKFDNSKSLLSKTIERISLLLGRKVTIENFLVLTNEKYKESIQDHLPKVYNYKIFLEPIAKNTAPAITLASMYN